MNKKDGELFTFMGMEHSFDEANAVVLMVPYEGSSSYGRGAFEGPELIIKASHNLEYFDPEFGEITDKVRIHTVQQLVTEGLSPDVVSDKVYHDARIIIEKGKFPVTLGGEHSISFGAVKACLERYPDLTVLQIDAHADLRDEYDGMKFSHACIMRRIRELGANTISIGTRRLNKEEDDYIKSNNISIFPPPFKKEYVKDIIDACSENVYVTIDADGFDPSVIPATGTPVPGGLLWHETLDLFRELFEFKNIVGLDFVEVKRGSSTRSEDTAAELVFKLLGYKFSR